MLTTERIKDSMECRWRVQRAKACGIFGILTTVVILIFMLSRGTAGNMSATLLAGGVFAGGYCLAFAVIAGYSLLQNRKLLNNYTQYEHHTVLLETPISARGNRRFSYYIVQFTAKSGREIVIRTHPLWINASEGMFPVRDYTGKKVEVLYDPKRRKIYVIGLKEK